MASEIIDEEVIVDDSMPADSKNDQTVVGSLSVETFFALPRALRDVTDRMKYLLEARNFKCVLPGKMSNDPIEPHFCLMRSAPGASVAIGAKFFCQILALHCFETCHLFTATQMELLTETRTRNFTNAQGVNELTRKGRFRTVEK